MTSDQRFEYGPVPESELEALDAVLGAALHFPGGTMRDWIARVGLGSFRAIRRGGAIIGGLATIAMGQWFGGRRVPLAGISAVGVAPEWRGAGAGGLLLRRALEELRAASVPLAALYPATLPYYQRAGFERAGVRVTYELPLAAIDVGERALDLVPAEPAHYAEIERAYERRARRTSGNLDRPGWMWTQKLEPSDRRSFRYLATHADQVEGYVVYTQGGRNDPLSVLDLCVLTPDAGRRLLALFAGYRSMVEHVVWHGGPLDPLVYLLGEQLTAGVRPRVAVVRSLDWMLRIVDVAGALAARGYPPGLSAELHLDVSDDLLASNAGRITLTVADGSGRVRPGGDGRIRLGVRELAAIYTGFMAPSELCAIGAIAGPEDDLALAGALFGGPRPWIADMF